VREKAERVIFSCVRESVRDTHMRIYEQKDANSRRSGLLTLTTSSLPRWMRITKRLRIYHMYYRDAVIREKVQVAET